MNEKESEENNMRFYLYNVICYDGVDAYCIKFILNSEKENQALTHIETTSGMTVTYIDKLYPVTLDNIVAMKDDEKMSVVYDRFSNMYF